jgi:hypothetical protein
MDEGALLLGGTYTFSGGAFAVVEVFHDGAGCDADRIENCFLPPSGTSDPADVLWRRNYLMLQLTHPRFKNRVHLTGRWIHGLDDGGSRAIGIYEHELGGRFQAFAIGAADLGGANDEFGSVIAAGSWAGSAGRTSRIGCFTPPAIALRPALPGRLQLIRKSRISCLVGKRQTGKHL